MTLIELVNESHSHLREGNLCRGSEPPRAVEPGSPIGMIDPIHADLLTPARRVDEAVLTDVDPDVRERPVAGVVEQKVPGLECVHGDPLPELRLLIRPPR